MWGIAVAHLYVRRVAVPRQGLPPWAILVVGVLLAYAGRLLRVTEVRLAVGGPSDDVFLAFGDPIMTLGFALVLWYAVSQRSWFVRILGARPLVAVGCWSYGIYLWHWYPIWGAAALCRSLLGHNAVAQYAALLLTALIVIPVGALSYRLLEAPYFRKRS